MYFTGAKITDPRGTVTVDRRPFGTFLGNRPDWRTYAEIVPRKGLKFETGEEVYIGEGKRDKVQYILGRCPREKLTENSKIILAEVVAKKVAEDESKYVEFYNNRYRKC